MSREDARPRRVIVAINPSASFGAKSTVGPALVQTLRASGHDVTSLTEPDFEQLIASAERAIRSKPDAFVVVGGDGMVNLAANLLARTKVPMGLVPSGTGNDMARGLGIPHDDTEAAIRHLDAALRRPPRTIDAAVMRFADAKTGAATEKWFACMLSAGFDAIVNERANHLRHPKGASRYILAMLIELLKLKPISYRLEIDGRVLETPASLVAIGNAISLGGGMKLTPDAKVDDGMLDVAVVQPLSRLGFLKLFPSVFKGTHVRDKRVAIYPAKRVRIEADVVAYADGERVAPLPIDVEVVPGALRVLA
ncbi:diacylglycerol kinase family protein [Schumannella sp. 10F1B-5-1]|uniref:diacylglycerol/lipid kinase family protein n=1 Tax=Schumannella sp. 10F1B-5-1 TaxID=2590780 RepID=UPI0011303601|nr:diacylglycerol kinase family protein [Schumannella sp. 10F1B-5-1]TPW72244.1 diacylglycerol kinase [Schumannella sp. 10F1B-5-1]